MSKKVSGLCCDSDCVQQLQTLVTSPVSDNIFPPEPMKENAAGLLIISAYQSTGNLLSALVISSN